MSSRMADPYSTSESGDQSTGVLSLSPSQRTAYDALVRAMSITRLGALTGARGVGKSRIAHALAAEQGGVVLTMSDVYAATIHAAPDKWEDAVESLVMRAFDRAELVIVDDFLRLPGISNESTMRGGFFGLIREHLMQVIAARDLRLVVIGPTPDPWQMAYDFYGNEAGVVEVAALGPLDYAAILGTLMGAERASAIDFRSVFRFASALNAYQLGQAAALMRDQQGITADDLIACLQAHVLFSNTRIDEVEVQSFETLPGAEAIFESLETHLTLSFENRELADAIGLKPKRGVLLYGPPGTGKTSIGRALAHRIKGKFFLIDGSFVSEPPGAFFRRVENTVQEAKDNAPSILFIDDADVLFQIQHIAGLSRYLLTLLDGLESESASNVCVMMTAMDASKIPDALLRSGRVELWLETRTPDLSVRERILRRWTMSELPGHEHIDFAALAAATRGFVAADLRRVMGDAKSLYAADVVAERPLQRAPYYTFAAINELVTVRARMAELLGDPALAVGSVTDLAPVTYAEDVPHA